MAALGAWLASGCAEINPDFDGPSGSTMAEGSESTSPSSTGSAEVTGGTDAGSSSGDGDGTGDSTSSVDPTGCEGSGLEECNGIDDDCDGKVDEWSEGNEEQCNGCTATTRDGTAYYFCGLQLNWAEAQSACEDRGADLTSSHDAGENEFLRSGLDGIGAGESWIGLNDQAEEGTLVWVDGTPLGAYTNWKTGNPDDANGEDCVEMEADGTWNDLDCALDRDGFACKDPSP